MCLGHDNIWFKHSKWIKWMNSNRWPQINCKLKDLKSCYHHSKLLFDFINIKVDSKADMINLKMLVNRFFPGYPFLLWFRKYLVSVLLTDLSLSLQMNEAENSFKWWIFILCICLHFCHQLPARLIKIVLLSS